MCQGTAELTLPKQSIERKMTPQIELRYPFVIASLAKPMSNPTPIAGDSSSRRLMRGRDKRTLHSNREFVTLRSRSGIVHAVRDLRGDQLAQLATDPEGTLWDNLDRPVKLGHGSQMVEAELSLLRRSAHVAYKRYRPRTLWKAFCGLFRHGRAWKSWHRGHALHARHIATARPLAMVECRGLPHAGVSYLVTEWIEDAENLHLLGWRMADEPLPIRLHVASRCAESVGRLVGRMHAWQIFHGDLKAANVLISFDQDTPSTYLIDVDDVRICRRLSHRRRVIDLARLATGLAAHSWVSRTVCRRFFRAYASQFPPGTIAWKPLWRAVVKRSRGMAAKMRRRGQPLL